RACPEGADGCPPGRRHLRGGARRCAASVRDRRAARARHHAGRAVEAGRGLEGGMSALSVIVSGTMLAQTVRMTIPYACARLGGVLSERSGVVNSALEGILLSSALAAVAAQGATGSAAVGVFAGIACGALVGLLHALLVVRGRIDAIVSGLAINLVAAGGT